MHLEHFLGESPLTARALRRFRKSGISVLENPYGFSVGGLPLLKLSINSFLVGYPEKMLIA